MDVYKLFFSLRYSVTKGRHRNEGNRMITGKSACRQQKSLGFQEAGGACGGDGGEKVELCGGPGSSACLFASCWACSLLLTVLEGTGELSGRKGAHQFQLCCLSRHE